MARLPSERFLIQQIGAQVVLFEEGTEREIVRFDPSDMASVAPAQRVIHDDPVMSADDKCFAHLWSGYFYAHATIGGDPIAYARARTTSPGTSALLDEVERGRCRRLGFTDGQVARGEDFGKYDFPNLGSPGPDRDNIREW